MRAGWAVLVAACAAVPVAHATVDLVGLALEGRWSRVLDEATRRHRQVPLRPADAMVAAHAARMSGDRDSEVTFLEIAASAGDLAGVAGVELATALVDVDPDRAVDVARPAMRAAETAALRAAAVDAVTGSLERGANPDSWRAVERELASLRGETRRRVELALAVSDVSPEAARRRLGALLAASSDDRVALEAAQRLERFEGLEDRERWWIGRALYVHALYERASGLLEGVAESADPRVPLWEVAFLRGRCAFRLDRFEEAAGWYARARSRVAASERAADLEVHLARALELAGDLEGAVEAARRAVVLRETDARRLFLARLRLRRGELELAELGVSRIRSRADRDRGYLMLGLDARSRGEPQAQHRWMEQISRAPWRQMAAVLMAASDLDVGNATAALDRLSAEALAFDPFWGLQARQLLRRMPPELVDAWRRDRVARFDQSAATSGTDDSVRELAAWAVLEPDPAELEAVRQRMRSIGGDDTPGTPVFEDGVARRLWVVGLDERAALWDPSGLPDRDAAELLWSATQLQRLGRWSTGLRTADRARARIAPAVPLRAHNATIRQLMFPSPFPVELDAAVRGRSVPAALVAAVAREESRWDPGVVSAVGARGLMQLMPATAARVGSAVGAGTVRPDDLFDPAVSLRLGASELDRLLAVFGGFHPAAIAAYNAGEAQARMWRSECGPGCDDATYVASITFRATRGYTADVLWASSMYRELWTSAGGGDTPVTVRTRSPRVEPPPGTSTARSRR
jgi:soluble lytic murein transglycosylase-like protein